MTSNLTQHWQSALQTFVAGFLGFIVLQLQGGAPIQWTWTFWLSIGLSAIRAGVKVLVENYAPVALGGKK